MREGDIYHVREDGNEVSEISVLETPGHRSDHSSFTLKNTIFKQNILFPCDMILGSPSVRILYS
jgi:glyoxylase-like metal-dependent hydrolase (beta-lactamase superfamily II)